jgi:hypothetical protein
MTTTVKVARIVNVTGNAADGWVTIKVQLENNSEADLLIHAPVADGLLAPLHQLLRKMADLVRRGTIGQGQVQAFDIQTVHVGFDSHSRAAIVIFDHGLPSQAGYRLNNNQLEALEHGLAQATKERSGKSRDQHH